MGLFTKLLHYEGNNLRKIIMEFMFINAGILLVAAGTVFFRNPNRFALGGVSGLSLLLGNYFPSLPIGSLMLMMNIALLAAGFIFLGKDTASKSLYGSFALSGMVWLIELLFPISAPVTEQRFMELIYGVFLPGIGTAIVFNFGATTGGTDIVAKILSKYFHLKVSIALLCADFLIALAAGLIFGVESGLFSVMGVCLKSFVLDIFLESLHIYKIVVVISNKSDEVKNFICRELDRGATVHNAHGAYTNDEKEIITAVLDRRQALRLQIFMKNIDPGAFITISNSSRIVGKGFERFE